MSQMELSFEQNSRDAAMDSVSENAGDEFFDDAMSVFESMSATEFKGEEIRIACEAAGIRPHHNNAWGAFICRLVRCGRIEPTGRYEAMRAPGSHARKTAVYRKVQ